MWRIISGRGGDIGGVQVHLVIILLTCIRIITRILISCTCPYESKVATHVPPKTIVIAPKSAIHSSITTKIIILAAHAHSSKLLLKHKVRLLLLLRLLLLPAVPLLEVRVLVEWSAVVVVASGVGEARCFPRQVSGRWFLLAVPIWLAAALGWHDCLVVAPHAASWVRLHRGEVVVWPRHLAGCAGVIILHMAAVGRAVIVVFKPAARIIIVGVVVIIASAVVVVVALSAVAASAIVKLKGLRRRANWHAVPCSLLNRHDSALFNL